MRGAGIRQASTCWSTTGTTCEAMIGVLDWAAHGRGVVAAGGMTCCHARAGAGLGNAGGRRPSVGLGSEYGTINFPVSGLGTGGALPRSGFCKTGRRLDRNDQLNPINLLALQPEDAGWLTHPQ